MDASSAPSVDARSRGAAAPGDSRGKRKTRARLPSDVWLGVAAHCSVDTLLELETTCKMMRDLARGKSMDSVWCQRFRMAEPALATVLLDQPPRQPGNGDVVVHSELSGRDFCRLYESRWRHKEIDTHRPQTLGVAPWDGLGHTPWNEPRVIVVVDDVAGEVAWNGYNGYGAREEDLSLTWVPNQSAAQREYYQEEIFSDVKTSCFLVDNQKIVELWREIREPADGGPEIDGRTIMTYQHGAVELFAFNRDTVPRDLLDRFAADHETVANYFEEFLYEQNRIECNLCTMICYLRFRLIPNEDVSRYDKYRLFDASISIVVHEHDTVTSLSELASLLKRILSPESSLARPSRFV